LIARETVAVDTPGPFRDFSNIHEKSSPAARYTSIARIRFLRFPASLRGEKGRGAHDA
jgi:hypothetical protein